MYNQMRAKASLEGKVKPEEIQSLTEAMTIKIKDNHKEIVEQKRAQRISELQQKDARQIVIDEVIGQSIPIVFIEYIAFLQNQSFGADIYLYIISFFMFRFFDILKPFPIGYFDKNYKKSFGILFDDMLAGIYTLIVLLLLLKFF